SPLVLRPHTRSALFPYTTLFRSLFDALFVEAFACRLAAEACETITNSNTKKQAAWAEYGEAIGQARRANAIERPAVAMSDDTWLDRKSTRLNSSHVKISYAVFCL